MPGQLPSYFFAADLEIPLFDPDVLCLIQRRSASCMRQLCGAPLFSPIFVLLRSLFRMPFVMLSFYTCPFWLVNRLIFLSRSHSPSFFSFPCCWAAFCDLVLFSSFCFVFRGVLHQLSGFFPFFFEFCECSNDFFLGQFSLLVPGQGWTVLVSPSFFATSILFTGPPLFF